MSELEIWNELGNIYYTTGAYDEAIRAYHKAIEQDHGSAQSYANLAAIYMQKEYFAEAVLMSQKAIELPEAPARKAALWKQLGDASLRLDEYGQAVKAYRTALELDPANPEL